VIAGVSLGENQFTQAEAIFGKAAHIERGDASTGREQVCYKSRGDSGKVYLVFEQGEVSDTFYLFSDGPDWNGSKSCVTSNRVSSNIRISSGLALGQTHEQVVGILGRPNINTTNKLEYFWAGQKKISPEEFKELRRQHQDLSDEELHRNYDYYDVDVEIEARFASSKLN